MKRRIVFAKVTMDQWTDTEGDRVIGIGWSRRHREVALFLTRWVFVARIR